MVNVIGGLKTTFLNLSRQAKKIIKHFFLNIFFCTQNTQVKRNDGSSNAYLLRRSQTLFLPMQNSARNDDNYKTVFYIIFGQHCTPFSFGVQQICCKNALFFYINDHCFFIENISVSFLTFSLLTNIYGYGWQEYTLDTKYNNVVLLKR